MPIRAALIDDSAVVRKHLADLLQKNGIEVTVTASDPLFAWPKLQADWPDVIVLDVEMPRMDGISFLHKLMAERPTPVVMCSTLTEAGCETTMQAMAAGAVSFVTKPKLGLKTFLEDRSNGLIDAVKAAARANLGAMPARRAAPSAAVTAAKAQRTFGVSGTPQPSGGALAETTHRVIAIGSSTGGVQTLEAILTALPRTTPGIVIVQHMPERFTHAFAQRLDTMCALDVSEARHGDRVIDGRVLIAPGGRHMRLVRSGAQYHVEVTDGPLVNRHKPSVDVLFRSAAQCAGRNAIGAILTGMGDDGARGLLEMRKAGARTAAQDEASCVVWGMPREAVRLGAADDVLALADIPAWLQMRAAEPVARGPVA
jgi:two-component system, chemotaxis family, protein-glutamate methylesterase/glutaminase